MNKTPEQMAEEYCASPHEKDAFLSGYEAAELKAKMEFAAKYDHNSPLQVIAAEYVKRRGTTGPLALFAENRFIDGYEAGMNSSKKSDSCEHILDMEKMIDVNSSSGWVSVKEQNPEARKMVLVRHKTFGVQIGFIDDNHARPCRNRWIVYVREFEEDAGNHIPKTGKYEHIEITHWMELPSAPKEEV